MNPLYDFVTNKYIYIPVIIWFLIQTFKVFYDLIKRISDTENNIILAKKNKYLNIIEKLDALSPLKTLIRGYSITEKNGKIIKSSKELKVNDDIKLRFVDGEVKAKVLERKN